MTKAAVEDTLKQTRDRADQGEARLKEAADEISKGNQIIQVRDSNCTCVGATQLYVTDADVACLVPRTQHLQNDLRSAKNKLKLKASVIVQQEQALEQKQAVRYCLWMQIITWAAGSVTVRMCSPHLS